MRVSSLVGALCPLLWALVGPGCGGAVSPTGQGVVLDVALGAAGSTRTDVMMASSGLWLAQARAVSDRSADDGRAATSGLQLDAGGHQEAVLADAPPALYSAVVLDLGDADHAGIQMDGTFNGQRLRVGVRATGLLVRCDPPVRLTAGGTVHLSLGGQPADWLDGIDLAHATSDGDEAGILIDGEDNAPLAPEVTARVGASLSLDCR